MIIQQALIIGANSGIAKAIAKQLLDNQTMEITLISRDLSAYSAVTRANVNQIVVNNYKTESIEQAVGKIHLSYQTPITHVFICHGVLHNKKVRPEKRLEDLNTHSFQDIMIANALTPLLWIQKLIPLLEGKSLCKVTVFSARVGSISDNRLGGWYSYRSSKAALNMMLKTAAIELARRAKNIKIIAFHPGTTDTPLSRPFQKNVSAGKLFTCGFVAKRLLSIIEHIAIDGTVSYLDWQGNSIDW